MQPAGWCPHKARIQRGRFQRKSRGLPRGTSIWSAFEWWVEYNEEAVKGAESRLNAYGSRIEERGGREPELFITDCHWDFAPLIHRQLKSEPRKGRPFPGLSSRPFSSLLLLPSHLQMLLVLEALTEFLTCVSSLPFSLQLCHFTLHTHPFWKRQNALNYAVLTTDDCSYCRSPLQALTARVNQNFKIEKEDQ